MSSKSRRRSPKTKRKRQRDGAKRKPPAFPEHEIFAALQQVVAYLQGGLYAEARQSCELVLKSYPEHPDALNLCGVACFQSGDADESIRYLEAAITNRENFADAYNNLGNVLRAVDKLGEAEAAYGRAIAVDSLYFDAYFNLGIVLEAMGRFGEAATANQHALEIRPDFPPVHLNMGNVLKALGRFDEALEIYRWTLTLDPRHVDALNNLGTVQYELRDFSGAEATYRSALEIDPQHADVVYNLGVVLQETGRLDEAIAAYQQAVEFRPYYGEGYLNLGYALHQTGRLDAAATAYERAIELEPGNSQAFVNLGDLMLDRGEPGAAVALCDDFLVARPGDTGVLAFKTVALRELGEKDPAGYLADFDGLIQSKQFETPAGFDSLGDFNAALATHICNHPTLASSPASNATREGKHSGELLVKPKGPMADWERLVLGAIDEYRDALPQESQHPFITCAPEDFRLTAWSVVMQIGGHQVPHIHPSAWLSGVYYVEVPDEVAAADQRKAGWIEFGRPPDHYHAKVEPELKLIKPQQGTLLLFPSYFYHRTVPLKTEGRRISIAFDVMPLARILHRGPRMMAKGEADKGKGPVGEQE